jgi:methylated-DNA-[protein]-cysteine S-methyltransferase
MVTRRQTRPDRKKAHYNKFMNKPFMNKPLMEKILSPLWIGTLDTGTPVGVVNVAVTTVGLLRVEWNLDPEAFIRQVNERLGPANHLAARLAAETLDQIRAYLAGKRTAFDLPVDWSEMAPFQQRVLRQVYAIPFGQVRTYAEVAAQVGQPRACRAVGGANAHNPMPLVVPCHRVVGSDRKLHGFGAPGGIATKAWLLALEGITL